MKKRILPYFIILYWLHLGSALAQETPRIINFTKDQYQAYNQNWGISQAPDLSMLFANSAGLLEFDGSTWQTFRLPNQQVVRSVACDQKGRIFTGAFSEIGYWQHEDHNKLSYHSLTDLVKDEILQKEEIWHILPLENAVLFQSFSAIYLYDYKEIRPLHPPGNIMFAQKINGRLILPVIHGGLFELRNNNGFELIPGTEVLVDKIVVCIIPNGENSFLVGTANNGIFEYRGGQLHPWNKALQIQLIANQLNKGIRLSNGNIVLGTILSGIYITNPQGDIIYHINQKGGLQNNTVLSLYEDYAKNLWVGLDKGIDLIELSSPLTFFKDINGSIGSVYAAAVYDGKFYIGSNQGVFVKDWKSGNESGFHLINGTQGQVWEIKAFDGQLLVGHNDGTLVIKHDEAQKISEATGGWITLPHPRHRDILVQGTYAGLIILHKDPKKGWQFSHRVNNFLEPVKKMVFDQNGNLWVVNPYRGLYCIQMDDSLRNITSLTSFTVKDGLPTEYKIDIDKINGQLIIKSNNTYLTYDAKTGKLRPLDAINGVLLPTDGFRFKTGRNNDWFQIFPKKIAYHSNDRETIFNLTLVPDYESIIPISEKSYLFGLDDGYAIFDPSNNEGITQDVPLPEIAIKSVETSGKSKNHHYTGKEAGIKLSANENNIHFSYGQPVFTQTPEYSYMLEGFNQEWSNWQPAAEKEFNRLPSGHYTFKVKSNLSNSVAAFSFEIRPHWYESWWASILYLIVLGAGGWLVERWNKHRLEKQVLKLEKEKEKQIEEERIKTSNERLQTDVINKSKELANSTMSLIQKNELLLKIKDEIKEIKTASDGSLNNKHYQKLLHLIDTNISTEHDWNVFETNFNQVHEQFFKRLKAEFPELTPGDLKLAAYLKMNLSSKDIAPLLNISIRSVENKRYRLRKKLDLNEEDNLTEFMLQY